MTIDGVKLERVSNMHTHTNDCNLCCFNYQTCELSGNGKCQAGYYYQITGYSYTIPKCDGGKHVNDAD